MPSSISTPNVLGETLEQGRRERLARRDAGPHAGERVLGQPGGQQRGEVRRAAEEERGPEVAEHAQRAGGARPRPVQDRARAHREREGEGVAQPVGEEELGDGERDVVRADPQDVLRVGLRGVAQRPVPVHRALGGAGGAGGVEPEGGGVGDGRVRGGRLLREVGAGRHEGVPVPHPRPGHLGQGLAGRCVGQHDDVGEAGQAADGGGQPGELRAEGDQPRAAVPREHGDVLGLEHRADRHRDRADPQAGQEGREQLGAVAHAEDQSLLRADPGGDQGRGEPDDLLLEVAVAQRAEAAVEVDGGDRPAFRGGQGVPGDQPLGGVEKVRRRRRGERRYWGSGVESGHDARPSQGAESPGNDRAFPGDSGGVRSGLAQKRT